MAAANNSAAVWGEPRLKECLFLLLVFLVCAVFHPALNADFLKWDDDVNISANPHLDGGLGWQQLKWSFTDTNYLWRYQPFCWLTWSFIRQVCGTRPVYYHLAVLVFHALNAGLVFLLVRKLLLLAARQAEADAPRQFSLCAALAAALWAVHPMRVETTAWAVELVFVQPLFFFLLALLCYLRSAAPGNARPGVFYWTGLGLFIVSLASYPLALGGLVVFVALDMFPLRRISLHPWEWWRPASRRAWLEKIPFAVVTLLFGWLNLHARLQTTGHWVKAPTIAEFGLGARAMQAFFIWAYYVWKPWLPFGLSPVPTTLISFDPFAAPFVLSALLVVGLTVVLLWQRQRWPGIFAVWLCHLALLVPVLGLSEHPHFAADRYSLMESIGWAVMLGGLFLRLWPRLAARRAMTGIAAVLICALGILSYRQTFLWQNSVGFFRGLLAQLGDNPKAIGLRVEIGMRLAETHRERGEDADAIKVLRTTITAAPDYAEAHHRLGDVYLRTGELDAARASYAAAIRLDPQLMSLRDDLGVAYALRGRLDDAEEQFAEVLRHDPVDRVALQDLARTLTLQGKTNEAKAYLARLKALPNPRPGYKK